MVIRIFHFWMEKIQGFSCFCSGIVDINLIHLFNAPFSWTASHSLTYTANASSTIYSYRFMYSYEPQSYPITNLHNFYVFLSVSSVLTNSGGMKTFPCLSRSNRLILSRFSIFSTSLYSITHLDGHWIGFSCLMIVIILWEVCLRRSFWERVNRFEVVFLSCYLVVCSYLNFHDPHTDCLVFRYFYHFYHLLPEDSHWNFYFSWIIFR